MSIMQLKRGTTKDWSLGPELIHFENLLVNGSDSTIHCEGIHVRMYAYTNSANYFPSKPVEEGKQLGLWLIQSSELPLYSEDTQYQLCMKVVGPEDCEVYVTDALYEYDGMCRGGESTQDIIEGYQSDLCFWVQWSEEKAQPEIIDIYISVKEIDAGNELESGQLGLEYANNGQLRLKAGMPNEKRWNKLPYIGAYTDLIPDYGTNLLPLNNIVSHMQSNDLTIDYQDGVFMFNGTTTSPFTNIFFPYSATIPNNGLTLKAGETYTLDIARSDDQFLLVFWRINFFDGGYIDNDIVYEYTPQTDTEVESIQLSIYGTNNFNNYWQTLCLNKKENNPTHGRLNKAVFPQKQFYTPDQQAQIRQNIQAAAAQYIIELQYDGDTHYISETWSDLEYLILTGRQLTLRYEGLLYYPDYEPSTEDTTLSFVSSDCAYSEYVYLWKNSTGNMSVDFGSYYPSIQIGEQIWTGYDEINFTDTINTLIDAKTSLNGQSLVSILPSLCVTFTLKGQSYIAITGTTWKAWIESGKAPSFVQITTMGEIYDTETQYPIVMQLASGDNAGEILATSVIQDQATYIAIEV